ncbi:cytochrome p450 [Trifolium pratense]|uniref:Cytochrome p450 n=1 Tax=Trifolium pratense TaxID=57577 RepID=A0A2K3L0Q7_TRIPR|nr:cytochrome p450 [Trifolium pratense]
MGTTNTSCVFCGAVEESVDHLFVSCDRISHVWYRVSRWVGMEYVSPNSIIQVFESFLGLGVEHRVQLVFSYLTYGWFFLFLLMMVAQPGRGGF